MHGKINDDKETVDPPINDKIGPKLGIDWATNKTRINTLNLITTLCIPNPIKINLELIFEIISNLCYFLVP